MLFVCFSEKVCYHFEGFGGPTDGVVSGAFSTLLERDGWQLIAIELELQSDGASCGVWIQVARDAYIAYTHSKAFGTKSFASFMKQWLQDQDVVRLHA